MLSDTCVNVEGKMEVVVRLSPNERVFIRLIPKKDDAINCTEVHVVRRAGNRKTVDVWLFKELKCLVNWGDVDLDEAQWMHLEHTDPRSCRTLRNAHFSFDPNDRRPPLLYHSVPGVTVWRFAA
jgi:hypothetical protein